jgi:hypothetical protein
VHCWTGGDIFTTADQCIAQRGARTRWYSGPVSRHRSAVFSTLPSGAEKTGPESKLFLQCTSSFPRLSTTLSRGREVSVLYESCIVTQPDYAHDDPRTSVSGLFQLGAMGTSLKNVCELRAETSVRRDSFVMAGQLNFVGVTLAQARLVPMSLTTRLPNLKLNKITPLRDCPHQAIPCSLAWTPTILQR